MTKKNYSLIGQVEEITLKNKEGVDEDHTLREMDGKDRDTYVQKMRSRMTIHEGKPTGMKNVKGMQTDLVVLCLYDDDGERLKRDFIEGFPATTLQSLFDDCNVMNGLVDDEEAESGND